MPPTTMSAMTTPSRKGRSWNPTSESENVENPALQNALTEWKTAGHAAPPPPKSGTHRT